MFEIEVEAEVAPPTAVLRWEYLAGDTWRPVDAGSGRHPKPDLARRDRVRRPSRHRGGRGQWPGQLLAARSAGRRRLRPAGWPSRRSTSRDPSRGFRLREDTGNLNPPVVESLAISYRAAGSPTVLTENAFFFQEPAAGSDIVPFVPAAALPAPYDDAEPALYLGFDRPFPEQPVSLYVALAPLQVAGRVARENRLVAANGTGSERVTWDYFDGRAWAPLAVLDGTDDLTVSGSIKFLAPADMAPLARFDLTERFWLRARTAASSAFDPTRLLGVFLNTAVARQSEAVDGEVLGSGTETGNQTLRLARVPVLADPVIEVREPELPPEVDRAAIEREEGPDAVQSRLDPVTREQTVWVRWHQVPAFTGSGPRSRHYLLDHGSGQRASSATASAACPCRPAPTTSSRAIGPAAARAATWGRARSRRSSRPCRAWRRSPTRSAPTGVLRPRARRRRSHAARRTLSHRGLAVTAPEIEALAMEVAGTWLARARALTNLDRELRFRPGWVTLLIVPRATDARPLPGAELVRRVRQGLAARTFAGIRGRLNVVGPGYVRVTVEATIVPADLDEAAAVRGRAVAALDRFLHPLTGGPDGTGWAFGRDVYLSEVCEVLERVDGVDHVEEVRLLADRMQAAAGPRRPADARGRRPGGQPGPRRRRTQGRAAGRAAPARRGGRCARPQRLPPGRRGGAGDRTPRWSGSKAGSSSSGRTCRRWCAAAAGSWPGTARCARASWRR